MNYSAFVDVLSKSFPRGIPRHLAVAVLGGVDSICLTHLLAKYRSLENPHLKITAITVDHQYRQGLATEARQVGALLEKWNVNHLVHTLKYESPPHQISNFEELARTLRYHALQKECSSLGVDSLFVAHTHDDQIETFVQRLERNSLLPGLRGLKARALLPSPENSNPPPDLNPIYIYRPLLGFTKKQLIAECVANNIEWFEDPTNKNETLTRRNQIRSLIFQKLINENQLSHLHDQVSHWNEVLDTRVNLLTKYMHDQLLCFIDDRNGLVRIELPCWLVKDDNDQLLSRYLHRIVQRVTPKRDHWFLYSKVETGLVASILNQIHASKRSVHRTYAFLSFHSQLESDHVSLKIVRLPFPRYDIQRGQLSLCSLRKWSSWVLFDGRFWLRIRSTEPQHVIIQAWTKPLKRVHFSILERFQTFSKTLPHGVPLLVLNGTIVAIPTYNVYATDCALQCEWQFKAPYAVPL